MKKNLIYLLILFNFSCDRAKNEDIKSNKNDKISIISSDSDCVDFVALWSAGEIAKKIGKDRKWVFLNYTVDLWDVPPTQGEGKIVGVLRASSYARIIEIKEDDYKVLSPKKIEGWINKEHVKTISRKNPKTNKLCQ